MKKSYSIISVLLLLQLHGAAQQPGNYSAASPDGHIQLQIQAGDQLRWSVRFDGVTALAPSPIAITTASGSTWGRKMRISKVTTEDVDETIDALLYKKDRIENKYKRLLLMTRDGYNVEFRIYNNGVAYRFAGTGKDSVTIVNETASFRFAGNYTGYFPYVNDPHNNDIFECSFENIYQHIPLSDFKDTLAFAPILVELPEGRKAAITEADLEDYPGMFLGKEPGENGLRGVFAPYPLTEKQGGHNQLQSFVTRRADYMARTAGNRNFPWRLLILSRDDRELLNNDLVYALASANRVKDVSWIKPGKVAWDWWNDWNISHVDFHAGINTPTYKYYIDFAAAHGIEYVLLDEGWASSTDILKIVPEIRLQELIDYARERQVGIWLWAGWLPLDKKMDEALSTYSRMGIKGFKVDFMDRDDQKMLQFYYRLAEKAAQYHLMIDFHGAFKPTGLHRTYPNVMNFEGVHGLEQVKWSNRDFPTYDVTIPYIRMLAGPMDYTPGAMRNATREAFRPVNSMPMSQGTRCHQLAMYVMYEAPFEMLADNPTAYIREPQCLKFMAGVPTVFDETVALEGKVAEYAALARRSGDDWYVGVLGNWDSRDLELNTTFLKPGVYKAEIFRDGLNADRDATDYQMQVFTIHAGDPLKIHLAPGGGWAARISPS